MIGKTFFKLTVISEAPKLASSRALRWKCLCSCGGTTLTTGTALRAGKTTSCGCNRQSVEFRKLMRDLRTKPNSNINRALNKYKVNARLKSREFSLTVSEFQRLVTSSCHYCGDIPQILHGIDRKDNSLGYTTNNCVSCCKRCNYAKATESYDSFVAWIARIREYKKLV